MSKPIPGVIAEVTGPYPHRRGFRVVVRTDDGSLHYRGFQKREAADAYATEIRAQIEPQEPPPAAGDPPAETPPYDSSPGWWDDRLGTAALALTDAIVRARAAGDDRAVERYSRALAAATQAAAKNRSWAEVEKRAAATERRVQERMAGTRVTRRTGNIRQD